VSGVQVGDRLTQLYALRSRVNQEIATLERARALEPRPPGERPKPKPPPNVVQRRLAELGVTARDVRRWALEHGLTESRHGRIGVDLVESYAAAHPMGGP
jgi:hypothetical protein